MFVVFARSEWHEEVLTNQARKQTTCACLRCTTWSTANNSRLGAFASSHTMRSDVRKYSQTCKDQPLPVQLLASLQINKCANEPLMLVCVYHMVHLEPPQMHVVCLRVCEWIGRMGKMFVTSFPIVSVRIFDKFWYLHPVSDNLGRIIWWGRT